MNNGLVNLGNTCYMNSIIQCLSSLEIFDHNNDNLVKEFINKKDNNKNIDLIQEWFRLNKSLKNKTNVAINPSNFLKIFISKIKDSDYYFDNFRQNDACEFITILLDLLHNELKHKIKFEVSGTIQNKYDQIAVDSINYWKKFFEDSYSSIIKNTYSQLLNVTCCTNCNNNVLNHDPIQYINLSLKNINNNKITLYELLNQETKIETLEQNNEWKCEKCKEYVTPKRRIMYWKLADILIIQIKLYNNKLIKLNVTIDFPLILNMDEYCINYYNDNMQYNLMGITIQSGSLNGGHYYSICKNKNKWFKYNDSHVTEFDYNKLNNITPYCLFYKRI